MPPFLFAEMAESKLAQLSPLEKFVEIVECGVCLETLSFPKNLRCQHSFCIGCLAKMLKATLMCDGILNAGPMTSISIICPCCKTKHEDITALNDLPTNFAVVQMIDALNEINGNTKSTHLCGSCNRLASDICATCQKKYCLDCLGKACDAEKHNGGEKAKHFIAEIPKEGEEGYRCREHNIVIEYYCTNCEKPVCLDCFLLSHRSHETKLTGTLKGEVLELLGKLKTINAKNAYDGTKGWNDASLLIEKIDHNQKQLSNNIKELHGKLEKFLQMLIEKVEAFYIQHYAVERQNILERFATAEVLLENSDTVNDLCSFVNSKLNDDLIVAFQTSVLKEMFTSCQEKSSALEDTMKFLKVKEQSLDKSATLEIIDEEFQRSMIRIFDNWKLKIPDDDGRITLKEFLQDEFRPPSPAKGSTIQETPQGATAIDYEGIMLKV